METPLSSPSKRTLQLPVAILCIAINVGLGTLVNLLKLPVYLDAAGTLAFALIFTRTGWSGFAWAAAVGALSFVLVGVLYNPVAAYGMRKDVQWSPYVQYYMDFRRPNFSIGSKS